MAGRRSFRGHSISLVWGGGLALLASLGACSGGGVSSDGGTSSSGSSGDGLDGGGPGNPYPCPQQSFPTGGLVVGSGDGTTDLSCTPYVEGSNAMAVPKVTSGSCPSLLGQTVTSGTKLTIPVAQTSNVAINEGMGNAYFWVLGVSNIAQDGTVTGTVTTCASATPPVTIT